MRLWHYRLIPLLDNSRLLSQHREVCALRGLGWGRKHSTVNYVFEYSPWILFSYHLKVIAEMKTRGYHIDKKWYSPCYRGKSCEEWRPCDVPSWYHRLDLIGYPEHNDSYLQECISNLELKLQKYESEGREKQAMELRESMDKIKIALLCPKLEQRNR